MQDPHAPHRETRRPSMPGGIFPPLVVLAVAGPLLLAVAGIATAVIAGGALGALVLPALFGKRGRRQADDDTIELQPDEYTRIDPDRPRLPRS